MRSARSVVREERLRRRFQESYGLSRQYVRRVVGSALIIVHCRTVLVERVVVVRISATISARRFPGYEIVPSRWNVEGWPTKTIYSEVPLPEIARSVPGFVQP